MIKQRFRSPARPGVRSLGTSFPEDLFRSAPYSRVAAERLRFAIVTHGVIVINCATEITDQEQIDISASLGRLFRLEPTPQGPPRRLRYPEILDQSNLDSRGKLFAEHDILLAYLRANAEWHSDLSFHDPPAAFSLLSVRGAPAQDGHTEFADTAAAYSALPRRLAETISELSAHHAYHGAEADHRLVQLREGAPSPSLYLASHIVSLSGFPPSAGAKLVEILIELATSPKFTYLHRWRAGDIVAWDNRTTMHRGRQFDDLRVPRDMRRTTVLEEASSS
jgi:alpha-ketoglutarate-dependent 2,4-dichlorophenoxyacetate dioxygenase